MSDDMGFASTGPHKARHVKNPRLVRLHVAHARRQARRLPGLTAAEREKLLAALARLKGK